MINLLRRKFIKDYEDVKNQHVREAHGRLASFVGIFSNLLLFIIKIIAGVISGSVAIIADSINNLSDMGSSVVTLIGFKMANLPADDEHPYGHERMEYIAGLIVAFIIIFVGGSLFLTSIDKIKTYTPEDVNYVASYISMGILSVSILIKLWQSLFNRRMGKIINSVALEATADDSRNDCISTGAILFGTICLVVCGLINVVVPFSIDGVLGILVSLFIIYSGCMVIKETVNPLLGEKVEKEYVNEILDFISTYDIVLGYHDVMCHMYGPTKCFMTLHVEFDQNINVLDAHEQIDVIEKDVNNKFGILLTIHMDPIETGNEELDALKIEIREALLQIDDKLSFHDLRMVKKQEQSTVLFDVVIPYKCKCTKEYITNKLNEVINPNNQYFLLISFDNEYVEK